MTTDNQKPSEKQVGGDHYVGLEIQPFHYAEKNKLSAGEANVVKYISRWRVDGGKEDLEKARHYVDLLIELYYPSEGKGASTVPITKTLPPSAIKKYRAEQQEEKN